MIRSSALVLITLAATAFCSPSGDRTSKAPDSSKSTASADSVQKSLTTPGCTIDGSLVQLEKVPEASGVAFSGRTPGVVWTHNDSKKPVVWALSDKGAVLGSVHVTGAEIVNWEDIAVASCPSGSCLYIGDIGDNNSSRSSIAIYRTPEPAPNAKVTEQVETMYAKYPDRPRDAEALVVLPKGDMFVVTKGEDGPSYVYRVPTPFRNGETVTLQWIGHVESTGGVAKEGSKGEQKHGKGSKSGKNGISDESEKSAKASKHAKKDKENKANKEDAAGRSKRSDRITGGGASPDGRWVVLRTHAYVSVFAADEFLTGNARQLLRFDVTPLGEPQGEGVSIANNGAMVLVGEGGGKHKPGTFARASCTLPPQP
jgi:hypothetical protein